MVKLSEPWAHKAVTLAKSGNNIPDEVESRSSKDRTMDLASIGIELRPRTVLGWDFVLGLGKAKARIG